MKKGSLVFLRDDDTVKVVSNDVTEEDVANIVFRNRFIASKLWCREDVESKIEELGYEVTDELVDRVINSGELNCLNDCTDRDWYIIESAIISAKVSLRMEGN